MKRLACMILAAAAIAFLAVSLDASMKGRPEKSKTDGRGHELVSLWKEVDRADEADRPQAVISALEKIIDEAGRKGLAWDFCDAWKQYYGTSVMRNWKLQESLDKEMRQAAEKFGEPVVEYYLKYCYRYYQPADSAYRFVAANASEMKAACHRAFYSGAALEDMPFWAYSALPEFVRQGISNDYEYAMWTLLGRLDYRSGAWKQACSDLAGYLGDSYPSGAYLEFWRISLTAGESQEAVGKALEKFAEKYAGRAIALYAEQALLLRRFNDLQSGLYGYAPGSRTVSAESLSAAFRALRDDCAAFEKARTSFKGIEKAVADGCTEVKGLIETLDSKEISHEWKDDTLNVILRNLDRTDLVLKHSGKEGKTVFETEIVGKGGLCYVPDTLAVVLPDVDDGDYDILTVSGKVECSSSYEWRSVSVAQSPDGNDCRIFAADSRTGEPLKNALIEVFDKGTRVFSKENVTFGGFELLGRDFRAEYGDSLSRLRLRCSYRDAGGHMRMSKEMTFSGSVQTVSTPSDCMVNCMIYKDRAAFNPGDTIKFKGVLYCFEGDSVKTLGEGVGVTVKLYGPDSEVVDEIRLMTNDFGSVAGCFALSEKVKDGTYRLVPEVSGRSIQTNYSSTFRVDDFVLPTFTLSFDDIVGIVFPGDSVRVSGRIESYTGHNLSGASVSYKVTSYSDVIAGGALKVSGDGRFSFQFKAGKRSDSYCYYNVEVLVTDATGETYGFSDGISVSYDLSLSAVLQNEAEGSRVNITGRYGRSNAAVPDGETAEYSFELKNTWSRPVNDREILYSVMRGNEKIASGKTFAGEKVTVDLSGMPSGEYRLEAECPVRFSVADGRDSVIVARSSHTLIKMNEDDDALDADVESVFKVLDGKDISLLMGASRGPVWAVVELWGLDHGLLHAGLVHLDGMRGESGSMKKLEYAFKDEYPDKVLLKVFYFRNGEDWSFSHVYRRPEPEEVMPLEFVSFTDKSAPGEECVYEVKALPGTEVLAAVFDKSTENIMPNVWKEAWGLKYDRTPSVSISSLCGNVYGAGRVMSFGRGSVFMKSAAPSVPEALAASSDEAIPFQLVEENATQSVAARNMADAAGSGVEIRSDFSNTLAFLPFLRTSADSTVRFSFDASDKISTYYVSLFAHDRSMRNNVLRREMLVSREVMLSVMEPQFLYAGDRYVMRASVSNSSDEDAEGMVTLYLYESEDYEDDAPVLVMSRPVVVPKGSTAMEEFEIAVPEGVDVLGFKVVFNGHVAGAEAPDGPVAAFSDGVFVSVPVRPAVQSVQESHSAVLLPGMSADSLYAALRERFVNVSGYGAEASEVSLSEMLMEALPDSVLVRGKDVISLADAIYSACLASGLRSGSVAMEAGVSPSAGNVPVYDENGIVDGGVAELFSRLPEYTNVDDGLAWFAGMKSSPVVTAVVMERLASLRSRGLLDISMLPEGVVAAAVRYLDASMFSEKSVPSWAGGISLPQYLHVRSMFADVPVNFPDDRKELADFRRQVKECLDVKGDDVLEGQILGKARRMSVIMNLAASDGVLAGELGLKPSALRRLLRNVERDMVSLTEYAVEHPSGGMYYPNAVMPFRGLLESELYAHSLLCDLLSRYASEAVMPGTGAASKASDARNAVSAGMVAKAGRIADGIRIWIMVQKETQDWSSDPAVLDAVASVMDGAASVGDVSVVILRQRFEKPFDEIKAAGNGFRIERRYYVERVLPSDAAGKVSFVALKEGEVLSVGDKVTAVYEIWNEENRSFVKMSLPRNAALMPENQLSGPVFGLLRSGAYGVTGLSSRISVMPQGYREVKSGLTNYFFDVYPEETTHIEEKFIVTRGGSFTAPVPEIECLYAPHYRANGVYDGKMNVN